MSEIIGELPSRGAFSRQLDTVFRTRLNDGSDLDLRLVKLDEHVVNATQENYSLLFQAPSETQAAQSIYRLDHDTLGEMDLFLVPVKRDESGLYYEAVFNLLRSQ